MMKNLPGNCSGLSPRLMIMVLSCLVCLDQIMCKPVLMDNLLTENITRRNAMSEPFLDGCDWIGTLDPRIVAEGSVQHQTLRCASGRIKWLYPEGAIRLTIQPAPLSPPSPVARQICLTTDLPAFKNVVLYLQDAQRLQTVFSPKLPTPERRCFDMSGGTATLYLESFYDHSQEGNSLRNVVRLPSTGWVEVLYDVSERG